MYFIANPSTSVYCDKQRPVLKEDGTGCNNETLPDRQFEFAVNKEGKTDKKCLITSVDRAKI